MAQAVINKDAETKEIVKGEFQKVGLSKQKIVERAGALVKEGSTWAATWKDLSTYVYPTKGFFYAKTPNQGSKIDHKTLIDEEATLDVDTFAAGMGSGFTSSQGRWFRLYIEDNYEGEGIMENESVKVWLSSVQKKMYDMYAKSNTYSVINNSMYKELATFGYAVAFVEEDYSTGIRLTNYTSGECYIGRDQKGRANAFYRKFWMKTSQMVSEFGEGNLSDTTRNAYRAQNQPDQWVLVHHLIEENTDRIPFLRDYKNMPWRSVYWEDKVEEDSYLKIEGYEEFPLLCPRFEFTTIADSYGKGPAWKALGAIKELQKKKKDYLVALAKMGNPPLQKSSGVDSDVNVLPGGITTFSDSTPNAGVRPTYEVKIPIREMEESIEKTKQIIKKFFFTDLFLMMIEAERTGRQITATEIMEKQQERLSKLAPILELWQGDEFIKALIERTFNIGMRNFIFDEPPEMIRGREIKIQYTSVLSQAQKMTELLNIDQYFAGIMQEAGFNPSSIDILNFDEKNRYKAEQMGIPPKLINTAVKMAEMRKEKSIALAKQQVQSAMLLASEAASKGGKAVKDLASAKLNEDNALDRVLASLNQTLKTLQGVNQ